MTSTESDLAAQTNVDGRRQRMRRGPLATRCLCPAIHDAACCSVLKPVTVVGFMSGIVTSTA